MNEFSIEARSLNLAIPVIGGFIRHDFWVLKAPSGNVIAELHGLATNRQTGQYVPVGTDDSLYSLRVWQFVHDVNYQSLLVDGIADQRADTFFQSGQDSQVVFSGSMADVLGRWNNAVSNKASLNALNLDYPAYGFNIVGATINSNSTCRTLGEIMGVPVHDPPVSD